MTGVAELGGVGVWSGQLRSAAPEVMDAARELDDLGYSALWIPGGFGGEILGDCGRVLDATERAVVATGILNLWMHEPADVATGHAALTHAHPDRFLLGIGVSHSRLIDRDEAGRYTKPLARTREFLDALDAQSPPVPHDQACLAALGPRMLELAREIARAAMGIYLTLPNYTNNLHRFGITDDDLADGGSDRLVDAIVAWGDEATIARRVQAHLDAGADHVCVQVLTAGGAPGGGLPIDELRVLAPALV